jgi:starvation-inducible outer membrane lipoprotein
MKKILAVAVALMPSACVTTGRKVRQEQVAQFAVRASRTGT